MFAAKRLSKELQKARVKLPPGISLVSADDFKHWELDIRVLDANPIYTGQIYRLVFIFTSNYPIEPPEVTFVQVKANSDRKAQSQSESAQKYPEVIDLTADTPAPSTNATKPSDVQDTGARSIPLHPHIYSNGIICLDLLGTAGWSPVQSVESVCMSLQSMLTGNTKAERPPGDREFCASMGPRGKDGWGGGRSGGWGRRGLRDVRFDYDDDTV